jgi:hypothetical protein
MLTELQRPYVRIAARQKHEGGGLMANKTELPKAVEKVDPVVAATLTGIIYQAKLFNRQARVNVPEEEVVVEVISLWRIVMDALNSKSVPGLRT